MAAQETLIIEARKLGGLIAQQPVVKSYRELTRQLELDIGARSLLEQFERSMELLAMKEASGQPLDLAEKQKIQSLQQSVAIHPFLKKLIGAQLEYMELMRNVQEAINDGVNEPAGAAKEIDSTSAPAAPASRLIIPG